jgi:hypothetical protein
METTEEVVEPTAEEEVSENPTPETEVVTEAKAPVSIMDSVDDTAEGEKDSFVSPYEDFELPDGMDMDKSLLEQALPKLKALNATQEQAQEFVDMQASLVRQQDLNNIKQLEAQRVAYGEELKTHETLGGDNYKPNLAHMHRALTQHGSPELREALVASGIDQHPAIFGLLVSVGKNLAEDTLEGAPRAKGATVSPENAMFPTTVDA